MQDAVTDPHREYLPSPSAAVSTHHERPWTFDVAWIGAAGIALYVLLRFPYAVFYSKLGTSPEEVGLDYTQMLTQSSFALALLLGGLGITMWVIARHSWWSGRMTVRPDKPGDPGTPVVTRYALARKDDDAFEAHMDKLAAYWSRTPDDRATFEHEAPIRRRLRELDRSGKRRSDEAKTLARSLIAAVPLAEHRRRKRILIVVLFVGYAFSLFSWILPGVASGAADRVSHCEQGIAIPGFKLDGESVRLLDSASLAPTFENRELLLLGGDSSRYVLYDCMQHDTLRVPTSSYVVVHSN